VFGREGYALPLGRAVQHTGEMNVDNPLEPLWLFGRPAQPVEGYRSADRRRPQRRVQVRAALNVDVQVFGTRRRSTCCRYERFREPKRGRVLGDGRAPERGHNRRRARGNRP
jgi:hypothetical protein